MECLIGHGRRWVVPIEQFPFVVGRQKGCNLSLFPKNVSRRHAEFFMEGGHLFIRDFGSTNGTYVNHRRITRDTRLESGDVIHFGSLEFRLCRSEGSETGSGDKTMVFEGERAILRSSHLVESAFREMIAKRAVRPYFQPIVKLSTMRAIGYEVVGRGFHKGLPSAPGELFKIAQTIGAEARLSQLFRYEGVRLGRMLPGTPNLFVNSHPAEMYQLSLLESLKEVRELAPAHPITLEISERSVSDLSLMKQLRTALRDLNIGLAYDDFGAGQARFVELIEVPPDFLKFDLTLIRNIHNAPKRFHHMVRTLVRMAGDLDIDTVAEGVESKEELDVCIEMGFNYAQGFFLGEPSPPPRSKKEKP